MLDHVFALVIWFGAVTDAGAGAGGMTTVGPFRSAQDCEGTATALQVTAGQTVKFHHLCVPVVDPAARTTSSTKEKS